MLFEAHSKHEPFQAVFPLPPVGHNVRQGLQELGAVITVCQMAKLVHYNVVDEPIIGFD